jgi:phosphoglycerate dehydrogenase-like enzyme
MGQREGGLMLVAAFAMLPGLQHRLFGASDLDRIRALASIDIGNVLTDFATADPDLLRRLTVLITGWGAPHVGAASLALMPRLAAILHAAGTVKALLSEEVWARGITVTNAAAANAVPVAEYALAMILLAGKRAFAQENDYRHGKRRGVLHLPPELGNYGNTVGIVAASTIGRIVLGHLRRFDMNVVVYDPYQTAETIASFAARKVDLPELLRESDVISIHAPDTPETRRMFGAEQLAMMRDGATLINTARPALVDHDALRTELASGRIYAILDVTTPEPLGPDDPLWAAGGAVLTPHIAGAQGNELRRLGASVVANLHLMAAQQPLQHTITLEQLRTMA